MSFESFHLFKNGLNLTPSILFNISEFLNLVCKSIIKSNLIFGNLSLFLNRLKMIDYFFVQDNNSKLILRKYSIQNVVKSGDSRFTSVIKTLNSIHKRLNK